MKTAIIFTLFSFFALLACKKKDHDPPAPSGSITITMQDNLPQPESTSVAGATQNIPSGNEVAIILTDASNKQVTAKTTVQSNGIYAKDAIDVSSLADGQITVKASVKDANGTVATATKTVTKSPKPTAYNYTSDYAYNLNVIYFVPANVDTNANYHQRLSEIMLRAQSFYGQWMNHWGYGDKTFGLLKDAAKARVKLIVIKTSRTADYYKDGVAVNGQYGYNNILQDMNTWFSAHPADKTSDHFLIITAVNERIDQGQTMPNGPPFAGTSGYCFALDYPGMSVTNLGTGGSVGDNATKWIGGMYHELGHGLNLPHSGELVSEKNSATFGTSLMGTGNYTYGKLPTFLTHSGCAILNNCQVFSKQTKTFYGAVTANVVTMHASYENGNIKISGRFSSNVPVTDVTYYHKPTYSGGDYYSMTFVNQPIGSDSFSINMPISEFREKGNQAYEFSLILNHDNGKNSWFSYNYAFQNDIPVIDFGTKDDYAKTGWTITGFSSQETDASYPGQAIRLVDNDINTYWHANWSCACGNTFPHWVSVDMGSALDVGGFALWERQDNPFSKNFRIDASNDGTNWTTVLTGTLQQSIARQNFNLPQRSTFRYFKLIVTSAFDPAGTMGSMAEVTAYK